jgi:hypothetical protein
VGGITLAWLIGEGIICWREVSRHHRPPVPGVLLASSGFFALCALLAEYQPARAAATLLAFGIDIAAYLEAPFITPPGPSKGNDAGQGSSVNRPVAPAGGTS